MKRTSQDTMRAVAIDRFGGPETIHVQELPKPDVGPDEVLIHVESAGVGVWDPYEREGGFAEMMGKKPEFPYVLGSDGAGTVAAVGKRVRRFQEGDRVYGVSLGMGKGFQAEFTAVKEADVAPVPEKLSIEQAGAMPVDAITALRGLDDALGLKEGETVMIFGASGGIGHLAVQLAKRMGANVVAVASGDDGVALARRLGADAVVEGHSGDVVGAARQIAPGGVDAALFTAGGDAAQQALEAIKDGGRIAYPNGVEPAPKPRRGVKAKSYDGTPDAKVIEKLNRLIEAGPFEVHVSRTFPLEQAGEALQALDQHHLGKLVLRPA